MEPTYLGARARMRARPHTHTLLLNQTRALRFSLVPLKQTTEITLNVKALTVQPGTVLRPPAWSWIGSRSESTAPQSHPSRRAAAARRLATAAAVRSGRSLGRVDESLRERGGGAADRADLPRSVIG